VFFGGNRNRRQTVKTEIRKYLYGAFLGALLVSSPVLAAEQGTLGETSEGSSDIEVEIQNMIQITDIDDITVEYGPTGSAGNGFPNGISTGDDVCIYTNQVDTTYLVTATGDGAGGAFTIESAAEDTIAYEVFWGDSDDPSAAAVALTSGVENATQFTNATNTFPCVTNNASFRIAMTHSNLMNVPAGVYEGTLTINVVPDDG